MKSALFIVAGLAVSAIVLWWITRPATCPRCGDRHSPQNGQHRADRATCSRCGCNFNPITGAKS